MRAYCQERGNRVDPQAFVDYYTSNGWMVGKNHMKDWKAAVRGTWEKTSKREKESERKKFDANKGILQRDYDMAEYEKSILAN